MDVENGTGYSQKSSPSLSQLIASKNLVDAVRNKFPKVCEFTFFRPGRASSRLDRFYLPKSFHNYSICHIASLSDHCAALLKMRLDISFTHSQPKVGRSTYWKLNTSILEDSDFLPTFRSFWSDLCKSKSQYSDLADWWDVSAKPEIKQFCLVFSKNRKRSRLDKKKFLYSYLKIVLDEKNWNEVARVREELHGMMLHDSMGIIIRS